MNNMRQHVHRVVLIDLIVLLAIGLIASVLPLGIDLISYVVGVSIASTVIFFRVGRLLEAARHE